MAIAVAPLIAAGITTVGNLLGNLLGGHSNASQQYAYQSKLAEQQFDYNKYFLQQQQNFNNPSAQMQMYRDAGVNPYASLGNNTSVSLPSSSQGSASSPGIDLSRLGSDTVSSYQAMQGLENEKMVQVAQAQQIINQAKVLEESRLKMIEDTKSQRLQNYILQTTSADHIQRVKAEVNLAWSKIAQHETQAALTELQALTQTIHNAYLPKQIEQSIAESASRIRLQYMQGQLTKAQASSALASAYESECRAQGFKIDNRLKNSLEYDYIDNFVMKNEKLKAEIERLSKQNNWTDLRNLLESVGSVVSPIKIR